MGHGKIGSRRGGALRQTMTVIFLGLGSAEHGQLGAVARFLVLRSAAMSSSAVGGFPAVQNW